jgi:hypothetical protein
VNLSRADYFLAVQSRSDTLDTKAIAGWSREKEQAFGALLAACGNTADGHPAGGDLLSYSDAAWARAEDLIESRAAPEIEPERRALHRFRKEAV